MMKIACAADEIRGLPPDRIKTILGEVNSVLGSVKAWVAAGFPVTTDQSPEHLTDAARSGIDKGEC